MNENVYSTGTVYGTDTSNKPSRFSVSFETMEIIFSMKRASNYKA